MYAQVLQIIGDRLVRLLLVQLSSFSVEILTFRAVLFQEAVKDFLCDCQVLPVRLIELLQKFEGQLGAFVLKLGVDLEGALEKPFVALLQVLGQSVVERLQLEAVLFRLLEGCRGDWGLCLFLGIVQGLLLVFLILILFTRVVLITLLVVLIYFLLALAFYHGRVEVVLAHVHVVVR